MSQAPARPPYKPAPWDYQGTELQQAPGVPPARFHAFSLPSRMGNHLHYPDGRVEPFPEGSAP